MAGARVSKQAAAPQQAISPYDEAGATGLKQWGGYVREEFLRELSGTRAILKYREMRDNDAVVGAVMFAIEMLLRAVEFRVEGVSASSDDQKSADFVESCLGDMEQPWPDTLSEILSFLTYGWSLHELVFKIRGGDDEDPVYRSQYTDGLVGWRKLPIRAQETLLRWDITPTGDVQHMIQLLPTGGPLLWVPLKKSLLFRTSVHKGNPEGRSLLRNVYRSWYYKKRIEEIEGVGIERDLCGVPVCYVPSRITRKDASTGDKAFYAQIKQMVINLRNDEQAGLVLPQEYDPDTKMPLFKLELLSTGGRRQFDTNGTIDRWDLRIMASVLADFIMLGQKAVGSRALGKQKTDIFAVALSGFLDMITAPFNRHAIPELLKLNGMKGVVKLTHGEVARRDMDEFGNFLLHAAQAGVLTPDPTLEDHVREVTGLPPPDADAMRDPADGTGGGGSEEGEPGPDDPQDAGGDAGSRTVAAKIATLMKSRRLQRQNGTRRA